MRLGLSRTHYFDYISDLLPFALRDPAVCESMPSPPDWTQGNCLDLAMALNYMHASSKLNEGPDLFPNAAFAALSMKGVTQHFTTQFSLAGARLFACGFGITDADTLRQRFIDDIPGLANGMGVTLECNLTIDMVLARARESGIPIPPLSTVKTLAESLYHFFVDSPRHHIYVVSSTVYDMDSIHNWQGTQGFFSKSSAFAALKVQQSKQSDSCDEALHLYTLQLPEPDLAVLASSSKPNPNTGQFPLSRIPDSASLIAGLEVPSSHLRLGAASRHSLPRTIDLHQLEGAETPSSHSLDR